MEFSAVRTTSVSAPSDLKTPGSSDHARQGQLFPDLAQPTLRDVANAVREAGIDGLSGAVRRADAARYQEVRVRSALATVEGMGFRYSLNPYRGCTHACEYCYARKYQRHLELGAGDQFSTFILVKQNIAQRLRREVTRPGWAKESVAIGTATDPYQPIEGHYRLTRQCIEVLVAADTPFSIVTKGPMVVRDLDLFVEATRRAGCEICMSVPSVDEDAWAKLEPGTAPPLQRLRALRTLSERGVETAVLMMPVVPGITTSPAILHRTVQAIVDHGLTLSGVAVARLDPGVREHFMAFLEREYPHLVEGYMRLYPQARAEKAYAAAISSSVKKMLKVCDPSRP